MFMKKYLVLLSLVAEFYLPLFIQAQDADAPHSIVGQVFKYGRTPPTYTPGIMFLNIPFVTVTLVAEGDTLRTESDGMGIFSFPEIKSSRIDLHVVLQETDRTTDMFSGTFDLMTGENFLLIPVEEWFLSIETANYTIVTEEMDDWVVHLPAPRGRGPYVADRLKDFPGAKYNRRKETITIPEKGIYRAYVDGAYVFALKPE